MIAQGCGGESGKSGCRPERPRRVVAALGLGNAPCRTNLALVVGLSRSVAANGNRPGEPHDEAF